MKMKVDTWHNSAENEILQESYLVDNGVTSNISLRLIELNEEGVRQGLIKLGWIPPED